MATKRRSILEAELRKLQNEMFNNETPETISQWALSTFGYVNVKRGVERALEEFEEIQKELDKPSPDYNKVAVEFADVFIVCCHAFLDFQRVINYKMAINRARKWDVKGDGTAYHIKEGQQHG